MINKTLISTVFVICVLTFSTAQASDHLPRGSEKVEFGRADLTYRVDKDVHKLVGQDVVDDKGDTIGTVENFVVSDPENLQYAIISVGGFLGIGDKLVAIPVKNLQMNQDKGNVSLRDPVTSEELENAPEFEYEKAETSTERFPEYGPEQN